VVVCGCLFVFLSTHLFHVSMLFQGPSWTPPTSTPQRDQGRRRRRSDNNANNANKSVDISKSSEISETTITTATTATTATTERTESTETTERRRRRSSNESGTAQPTAPKSTVASSQDASSTYSSIGVHVPKVVGKAHRIGLMGCIFLLLLPVLEVFCMNLFIYFISDPTGSYQAVQAVY
jgi:hypothetical protein